MTLAACFVSFSSEVFSLFWNCSFCAEPLEDWSNSFPQAFFNCVDLAPHVYNRGQSLKRHLPCKLAQNSYDLHVTNGSITKWGLMPFSGQKNLRVPSCSSREENTHLHYLINPGDLCTAAVPCLLVPIWKGRRCMCVYLCVCVSEWEWKNIYYRNY